MSHPWSNPEPATAPTAPGSPSPAPADPWAGSSYDPVGPHPTPVLAPPPVPPRRRWLAPVAVATGLLAVIVFVTVVFWPGDGEPGAPLRFQPITEVGEVEFHGEGAEPTRTHLAGDRLYATAEVGDDLEVVAADVATGAVRWRTTVAGSPDRDWQGVLANSTVLLMYSDSFPASQPGLLVALDTTDGGELWRRDMHQHDVVYLRENTLAFRDHAGQRLIGLDPRGGREVWEVPYPSEDSSATVATVSLHSAEDFTEPAEVGGGPAHRHGDGVVLVGPDRSARLIDLATGDETWVRSNVAGPGDFMFAYEDRLYVADDADGYRILGYDLTSADSQPRTLYTVEDTSRRPATSPRPCGEDRLCLLDRSGSDGETTELVAVDIGDEPGLAWRRPAPGAGHLVPVGDLVIVNGGAPPVVVYDHAGDEVLERDAGYGLRLDAGNVLLLGDELSSYQGDLSLLGYPLAERRLVALDTAREVYGAGCAWSVRERTAYLACPTPDAALIWRMTAA